MIGEEQAQRLLAELKNSVRKEQFAWSDDRHDERFYLVVEPDATFVLTLRRNPFRLCFHLRTERGDIGLMRADAAYHVNPDGTELDRKPHLHVYREGCGLAWARPIDWYEPSRPVASLEAFLHEANASFRGGIQNILF